MKQTTGIVFISGTGLNRFLWNDLKEKIRCPALVLDFSNSKNITKLSSRQLFEHYVEEAVATIKRWDVDHFIIVAHSVGGILGLRVAKHFKEELRGFIAISCVIPKNGQSFFTALPVPQRMFYGLWLAYANVEYVQKMVRSKMFGDLREKQVLNVMDAYTREKRTLYTTNIKYAIPDTERLYIKMIDDRILPSKVQDEMIFNFQATKIDMLEGGHFPMLKNEDRLISILKDFIYNITF